MNRKDDLLVLLGAALGGLFVRSLDRFSDDFMNFERDQGAFERRDAIR